jgi:oxalate decarboxylase/phosphoglucose isomerase-like protein (cupin superfamily)
MSLPKPAPIREIESVDRARFDAEVRPSRQPAIFRGLARDWPAVQAGRTSPEAAVAYLKRFSQPGPVLALVGDPDIEGRFSYTPDLKQFNFQRGTTPLDPFLDRLLRDQKAKHPYAMAVQSLALPEALPGFLEANRIDLLDAGIAPRIWIGNAITVGIHYDRMENVGVVMSGRRRFTVFPPEQIGALYPGPFELTPAGVPVSLVDMTAPDLDRYPRFAEAMATAQTAVLEPGDAIYLPFHWWHGVESLDAVNAFVNYWWNPAPAHLGKPEDALLVALTSLRGLPDDQREVWRALFDYYIFGANGDAAAHLPPEIKGILGPITPGQVAWTREALLQSLNRR